MWSDRRASIVVTTRRRRSGEWYAADFTAWPIGQRRAGALLDALCAIADERGVVITARAGSTHLHTRLYRARGFEILTPGERRPQMRRRPAPRVDHVADV